MFGSKILKDTRRGGTLKTLLQSDLFYFLLFSLIAFYPAQTSADGITISSAIPTHDAGHNDVKVTTENYASVQFALNLTGDNSYAGCLTNFTGSDITGQNIIQTNSCPYPSSNVLYHFQLDYYETLGFTIVDSSTFTAEWGCTDVSATNFNADATVDDGSCTFPAAHHHHNPSAGLVVTTYNGGAPVITKPGSSTNAVVATSSATTSPAIPATTIQIVVPSTCLANDLFNTITGVPCAGATPPSASPAFTKDLKLGDTDPDVKLLQIYLNAHGYALSTNGAGTPGHETDYFGPATKAAVANLQKANNILPAVGYFGPLTRSFVNSHQ